MTKEQVMNEINNLSENELIKHASISVENNHHCETCYTCMCLAELNKRRAYSPITITDIKLHNLTWFGKGNKKFFGDLRYSLLKGKDGKLFLLRSTTQWSDMFGQPKSVTYRINEIDSLTLKIGKLLDDTFTDRDSAKRFIKEF